jgi:UDP-N-acetyl-D-glucosamine/UDP-N-acetyl-D-galactosamine dehydrogenase
MKHNRKISVVGMGYVGLPVAVAFGKLNAVIGFDINEDRIAELQSGLDKTNEVSTEELKNADIIYTSNPEDLKQADFHIIAVPTPITDAKSPNMEPLLSASLTVGKQLKPGDIVVYESTVYPGATEEDCMPVLERESGLKCGSDFYIGYSPERINPGDKIHTFTNIMKIVSGQNDEVLEIVASVYASVIEAGVHKAPSIKVAEAAKVIENTQRDINIALMNELALIFDRLDIDTKDVLEAAGTKWNFLPFTPGLVGGHCIGIDPYYLSYKASKTGYIPDLILAGRHINDAIGNHIASQVVKYLIKSGERVDQSVVTILGLTFKENVPDVRNTRVVDIVVALEEFGIDVQVHDPVAETKDLRDKYNISLKEFDELDAAKAVIFAVPHEEYVNGGWDMVSGLLCGNKGVVFDVKGKLDRSTRPDGIILKRL